MKCNEIGLNEISDYYFYTPNNHTKSLFYHALSVGEFYCDAPYSVHREHYNSYLYIQVIDGTLNIKSDNKELSSGDAYLLDCYQPHTYSTNTYVHFLFAHIDGLNTRSFYESIKNSNHLRHSYQEKTNTLLQELINHYRTKSMILDGDISIILHQLMIHMLNESGSLLSSNNYSEPIDTAVKYIQEHFTQPLSIEAIANVANLSPFHFSRRFKNEVHQSPYDFLISQRIDLAKTLLKSTNHSIEDIAYAVGFKHLSGFSASFKKTTGQTAGQFRRTPF